MAEPNAWEQGSVKLSVYRRARFAEELEGSKKSTWWKLYGKARKHNEKQNLNKGLRHLDSRNMFTVYFLGNIRQVSLLHLNFLYIKWGYYNVAKNFCSCDSHIRRIYKQKELLKFVTIEMMFQNHYFRKFSDMRKYFWRQRKGDPIKSCLHKTKNTLGWWEWNLKGRSNVYRYSLQFSSY